jgi:hypothetical protein
MSETPETDAELRAIKSVCKDEYMLDTMADFARKLERDRNEAREAFVIAADQMVIAQGKTREAIKAIRETLEENRHLADGDNCTLRKLKEIVPDWK